MVWSRKHIRALLVSFCITTVSFPMCIANCSRRFESCLEHHQLSGNNNPPLAFLTTDVHPLHSVRSKSLELECWPRGLFPRCHSALRKLSKCRTDVFVYYQWELWHSEDILPVVMHPQKIYKNFWDTKRTMWLPLLYWYFAFAPK